MRTHGYVSLLEVRVGGLIGAFECHKVTVRGGQEGQLVPGTSLITLVHLVTWVGYSQPACGDIEASGKIWSFQNVPYNKPMVTTHKIYIQKIHKRRRERNQGVSSLQKKNQ